MKYRIRKKTIVASGKEWFYPECRKGWWQSWEYVDNKVYNTIEEAQNTIDRAIKIKMSEVTKEEIIKYP